MKTVLSLVLVLALVSLSACAPKVDDPADVQAVKQTMEAFTKSVNAKDATGAVSALTDKTVWLEAHLPGVVGKDAVAKLLQSFFVLFKSFGLVTTVSDVRVAGDLALMHGTYRETNVPVDESTPTTQASGSWMIGLSRQADRSWKWDTFIVNSDQPMPGTTADGAEEQAVMQFERDGVNAMLKRDMAFIDRSLAKEYTSVADGKVNDMTKMMAEYKAGAIQFESFTLRDLKAYVFGDAAIATMTAASKGTYKGTPISDNSHVIDFLVKRDGRWQLVSTQSTTIKQ
jgi:ketosteroid isomerase-like protein